MGEAHLRAMRVNKKIADEMISISYRYNLISTEKGILHLFKHVDRMLIGKVCRTFVNLSGDVSETGKIRITRH